MSPSEATPLLQERVSETSEITLQDVENTAEDVTYGQILALAKNEKYPLIFGVIALAFSSFATVALPGLAGHLVDNITIVDGTDEGRITARNEALKKLLGMLGIALIGSVSSFFRSFLFSSASERIVAKLRSDLFKNLTIQDVSFFDRTRTGELLSRLSEDCQVLKNAATTNLSDFLRSGATGIAALICMFATSWKLTLLTLLVVPPSAISIRYFGLYLKNLSKKTQEASAEASSIAEETLGSIRTVRSFAQEETESFRYNEKVQKSMELGVQQALAMGLFAGLISSLAFLCVLSVLFYGTVLAINGEMTAGALSAFLLYSTMVGFSFGTLSGVYASSAKAQGSGIRVFQLLERKPSLNIFKGKLKPHIEFSQSEGLVFENVWFSYPSRPSQFVLKGINLRLPPGSRVALVGPSGGGKSTIASLAQRLYDPQVGKISLSGIPLSEVDHNYLHSVISIVSQEPVLFHETVAQNIAYFNRLGFSQSQVEESARLANALGFISQFPEGFETVVGEKGVRLSGGQKQRVAIARAIFTDPKILLLDEATSALDAESEFLVQEAMDHVMEGRSTLVIAHRLSTVKSADLVVVVDNGVIVEEGSHEELLEKNGVYSSLVRRQLQGLS